MIKISQLYIITCSPAVAARTPKHADLIPKHGGHNMVRPVRADKSQQTGLFGRGALKLSGQMESEEMCSNNGQYEKNNVLKFVNHFLVEIYNRPLCCKIVKLVQCTHF